MVSHGAFRCPPFDWDPGAGRLSRILRIPGAGPRPITVEERIVKSVEIVGGGRRGARPEEVRRPELRLGTPGWTPGEEARLEVEEAVVFMLSLDRDLRDFHRLCREDPALSRIPQIGAGRLLRCPTLWEELTKAIYGSAAPWERALAAIEAVGRMGREAPGGHAWPPPDRLLEAGAPRLEEATGLGEASSAVLELAERIDTGALDPGPAEGGALGPDELESLFRSVRGIDEPAARRLLVVYGHADHLPVDAAALSFLADRHFGGRTPTLEEVRERYERYGEWKGLAYWLDFVQEVWWPALGIDFGG